MNLNLLSDKDSIRDIKLRLKLWRQYMASIFKCFDILEKHDIKSKEAQKAFNKKKKLFRQLKALGELNREF